MTYNGWNQPAYGTDWKTRTNNLGGLTNNTFYIFVEDLKVKIGAGNPGCDHAIYWACAQQTALHNVTITADSATKYALETGLDGGGGVIDAITASGREGILAGAFCRRRASS